ncbi:beta-mannosidase [Kribbella sp. NPDC055071]
MSTLLHDFDLACTDSTVLEPTDAALADADWLPARVPGGVHESLVAAGRIAHPYHDMNDAAAGWVERRTWWYRTRFTAARPATGQRLTLLCPTLDTVASVWLNGTLLGRHTSQFRPARFDVTGVVAEHNELIVRFSPPLEGLTPPESIVKNGELISALIAGAMGSDKPSAKQPAAEDEHLPGVHGNLALTLRRKATFSWGWDFAPRLPSVGVLSPVELHVERGAVITGQHIRSTAIDLAARTATVAVDLDVDAFAHPQPVTAVVRLTSTSGASIERRLELVGDRTPGNRQATATIEVDDAEFWWPHDLGEPRLYDTLIRLQSPDGTVLDEASGRLGLRIVTLDRSPDPEEGGRLFRFSVNGTPTYARGANWVPADTMIGSVTAQRCRALVAKAKDAGMNMLRVWAGGTYEQDAFYAACDEAGILLWHDFMFACTEYPSDDPTLRAEVAAEAEFQTRRLRNHASLALWCGNNEVHAIHGILDPSCAPGDWGYAFFHEVLPDAVARNCPEIAYWPGSPWGEDDPRGVNGVRDGDRHAWEVWHGVDVGAGGPTEFATHGEAVHFRRYAYDHGKFISEFGIHAAPELATLERWTEPGTLTLGSPQLLNRNKDMPKNKGDDLMAVETGLATDLREYLDFSMATQAEGLKFGIEHYRRRQPHNSGTLVWQLNDAWPGMSWSIIDYDLIAKAGYYFVQRSYQPVLASFARAEDGGVRLWVTNSSPNPVTLQLRAEVATFAGKHLADDTVPVTMDAYESRIVWSAAASVIEPATDRFAWVSDRDGVIQQNRMFFAALKDLDFGAGRLESRVIETDCTSAVMELRASGYCYMSRIASPTPGVSFSANYLDLRDGDAATIRVTGLPDDFDAASLRVDRYAGQDHDA